MKSQIFTKASKYLLVFSWLTFFYIIAMANNDNSTVFSFGLRKNINLLFPQGWGFFTKDPKEIMVDAYIVENGKLRLITELNTSKNNFFGLSRSNRFVGFELSLLLGHIPREAWKNEVGEFEFCLSDSIFEVNSLNVELKNFALGKSFFIHQYKPIPFQWASLNQEKFRPSLTAFIKIEK